MDHDDTYTQLLALLDQHAVSYRLIDHAPEGRTELVSSFDDTIDYRLHYQFSPDDLTDWPGKVLVLQLDDDPATGPEMRQTLRQLYPQTQVHTFQRASHTPFLSRPDEFYPLVNAFLHQACWLKPC
jgi:pimeloyl-ACP methyl ester carboxylesterase